MSLIRNVTLAKMAIFEHTVQVLHVFSLQSRACVELIGRSIEVDHGMSLRFVEILRMYLN